MKKYQNKNEPLCQRFQSSFWKHIATLIVKNYAHIIKMEFINNDLRCLVNRCPSLRNYSLEHKALGKSKECYCSLPRKVKEKYRKGVFQNFLNN